MASRAALCVRDPGNEVYVSAASTWEIAIKAALGKIKVDLAQVVEAARATGFAALPISISHTLRLRDLPSHHRDPFDRILIAQALEEGLTIVTHDPAFGAYPAPTLWS
jgi:PIN domain nuclease of toxin-antitoxin system